MKCNDSQPTISIITVSFNSEKTIERTIKSVLGQGYSNLEYIIVDGDSTDNTCNIIKKYDDVVDRWISEPDEGISDAFNKGIRMATGEIIGLINSDDGLEPGALKELANNYDADVDIYRGNIFFWNEKTGKKVREVPSMQIGYYGRGVNVCHQGTFISKKAYLQYGLFNEQYKYGMDYDLLLRFYLAGAKLKYINYDMAYFTMNGITFDSGASAERRKEVEIIIRSNGGNIIEVLKFRFFEFSKQLLKRVVPIDWVLMIKNAKDNCMKGK